MLVFFPYITEFIGSLMFVLLSIPLKYINLCSIHKTFITALCLLIISYFFLKITKQGHKIKETDIIQNKSKIRVSFLYSLFLLGLVTGFQYLPVSLALPLHMSIVPFTLITNYFLNKKIPNLYQVLGSIIIFIGIILASIQKEKYTPTFIVGIIALIISSISMSFVAPIMKKEIPDNINNSFIKTNLMLFDNNFFGIIILGIISILYTLIKKEIPKIIDVIKMIMVVLFFQYIIYLFYYFSLEKLSVNKFLIFSNIEIVISLILGYFFFKEHISLYKIIGIILIIFGIFLGIKRVKIKNKAKAIS